MEEKYYGLGAGRLYIAPWHVSEEEARSLKWYAGPTKGGVTMAYSAKVHEIKGWGGEIVRSVRYGEKITLTGKLSRLYPRVLAAAVGAPIEANTVHLGGKTNEGRHARLRVILVCALPASAGGGEIVFSMCAAAASPAAFVLSPDRDSAWSFSLTAETDDAGLKGKLVFA